MKLIAVVALLAFFQATPPIPRKATDSTTNARQSVQKNAPDSQTPATASPTTVNPVTPQPEQSPSNPASFKDTEQSIRVRELPPVSVAKDWSDWGIWAFSGLLVIVGFLQWRVIRIQANLLREHAGHLEKLADAAVLNAQAARLGTEATQMAAIAARDSAKVARDTLYLTQAADVHIEAVKLVPKEPLSGDTVIYVVVKNHGQTRAEKFTLDLTLGIKERAAGIALPRRDTEVIVGAGQSFSFAFGQLQRGLTQEDLAMVMGGQALLKLWGPLKYRDIFGNVRVIDCEGTYNLQVGNFLIDRYEHHHENDAQAN